MEIGIALLEETLGLTWHIKQNTTYIFTLGNMDFCYLKP
jgi:hypothetical protein